MIWAELSRGEGVKGSQRGGGWAVVAGAEKRRQGACQEGRRARERLVVRGSWRRRASLNNTNRRAQDDNQKRKGKTKGKGEASHQQAEGSVGAGGDFEDDAAQSCQAERLTQYR
jgi:hypothetical protein